MKKTTKKTSSKKSVHPKTAARPKPKAVKKTMKKPVAKPKVAFYWCSSCGGCEETIVDFNEKLLDVVGLVDIVFWPCALDFKTSDVEAMADQSLAAAFINGAIRTSEQETMVQLLRKKAKLVVAFGSCASQGGLPALANLTNKEAILNRAYVETETTVNPEGVLPQEKWTDNDVTLTLPRFYDSVSKLDDVIRVDYYLPGCPPTVRLVEGALQALLSGQLPPAGTVLAPNRALCFSCTRNSSKPDHLTISELKRVHQVELDPERCFLAQGVLCMGPATRDGCGQMCINGHMPCTGCFGPLDNIDQGAKFLAAIGGLYQGQGQPEAQRLANSIPDPAGTFYRYGLAGALLGKRKPIPKE